MKEQKTPRKPLIYYAILAFTILMLLNAFVFPTLFSNPVVQTDYGDFLSRLESGTIDKVEINENIIYFVTSESGEEVIYSTGAMQDADLTNRLFEAGVTFTRIVPKEASPITSFIVSWVLPIAIFFLLGRFLIATLQKRTGGANAMKFGK